jgi:membrane dipeptidase
MRLWVAAAIVCGVIVACTKQRPSRATAIVIDAGTVGPSVPDVAAVPTTRSFAATDLHVDLGWQIHSNHASILDTNRQASLAALTRGNVGTLIVPLFVDKAYAKTPTEVRAAYDATFLDVQRAFERDGKGSLGAPFAALAPNTIRVRISFEGADGFADDFGAVVPWVKRGACLWGLIHSRNNALGGSSQDPSGKAPGMTTQGTELANALVMAGGVLDIAHASDASANELLTLAEAKRAPVVATHTGMRALYNIKRNISDDLIKRVASSGGIVGVSFYLRHLTAKKQATLDDVVAHIEHLRAVGGARVLALGSDFEGDIVPPIDAPTIAALPELLKRLRSRGFTDEELEAFFHGNADRVFAWAENHGCGSERAQ